MKQVLLFLLIIGFQLSNAQIDIQGHRGARGNLPENTIEGMLFALDVGVRTLEMDVVISKDSKVVLSHEPWMSHLIVTQPDGAPISKEEEHSFNLFAMTYEEIAMYDCGLQFHSGFPAQQKITTTKPLLSEVIAAVESRIKVKGYQPVFYNVEIKSTPEGDGVFHPDVDVFCRLVLEILEKRLDINRFIIQSFDTRVLKRLHKHRPEIQLAYLIEDMEGKNLITLVDELGFIPEIISPYYVLIHESFMEEANLLGMKIIPWTINDKDTMIRLDKLGVHGIITDYPEIGVEWFGSYN